MSTDREVCLAWMLRQLIERRALDAGRTMEAHGISRTTFYRYRRRILLDLWLRKAG